MSAIFGSPKRTVILYLEVEPRVSMERCLKRDALGHVAIEPHQTLETMEMLRQEFRKVTEAAVAKGYDLLAIDTTHLTLDQVAGRAEDALRRRLSAHGVVSG
jgi:thymidylate kinase